MLNINRYQDITKLENEAKKDYIDRHTPFIHTNGEAKKGELHPVTIKMGQEFAHPDDFDHFISQISLFNKNQKLAEATFLPGALGNVKGHMEITFNVVFDKNAELYAQSYCTKHGIWESDPQKIYVQ